MTWTVTIRYKGKNKDDPPSGRSYTSHADNPVEAIQTSIDRINLMLGGDKVDIVSISVTRDS